MPLNDPVEWFEDLNVHIDDKELIAQASALEPTLLHGGSRLAGAAWTIAVSAIAGAFGGFTFSDAVRSSWPIFLGYLVFGALLLRFVHPLTTRLIGAAAAWQVLFACFWSFILAMTAVLTGRIETVWLRHAVSIFGGLFVGLMYGSLNTTFIGRQGAWLLAALPLGALSTWSAAALQRAFDASSNPPWSEAYVGTMAATVFMAPMGVLLAMLSSRSNGLAKMATLYLHNDNFLDKAIAYLDEAIVLSPRSADLYNLRGIAHSKNGDADRADADFRKVTELSPRAAEAHMNRGVDFLRQEDFDRAIDALTRAIAVNPKLPTAFSNLGTAQQKKGDLDAAIDSYSRAIALRAKYPIAFANRAYAYFLKGEHELAIADATHAISLEPQLPMAHVNRGHALAARGDVAAAVRSYREALALSPDQAVAEETLKALEALGARADDDDDPDEDDR